MEMLHREITPWHPHTEAWTHLRHSAAGWILWRIGEVDFEGDVEVTRCLRWRHSGVSAHNGFAFNCCIAEEMLSSWQSKHVLWCR